MPGPDPRMILDMDDAIDFGANADIFRPSRVHPIIEFLELFFLLLNVHL
jgi:hypothetical protein